MLQAAAEAEAARVRLKRERVAREAAEAAEAAQLRHRRQELERAATEARLRLRIESLREGGSAVDYRFGFGGSFGDDPLKVARIAVDNEQAGDSESTRRVFGTRLCSTDSEATLLRPEAHQSPALAPPPRPIRRAPPPTAPRRTLSQVVAMGADSDGDSENRGVDAINKLLFSDPVSCAPAAVSLTTAEARVALSRAQVLAAADAYAARIRGGVGGGAGSPLPTKKPPGRPKRSATGGETAKETVGPSVHAQSADDGSALPREHRHRRRVVSVDGGCKEFVSPLYSKGKGSQR